LGVSRLRAHRKPTCSWDSQGFRGIADGMDNTFVGAFAAAADNLFHGCHRSLRIEGWD